MHCSIKLETILIVILLKASYFAIFDSHINYANLIWGQNPNSKLRVITLQKKALRIINNQPKNSLSGRQLN